MMEPPQRMEGSSQLTADNDGSHSDAGQDQKQSMMAADDLELQQPGGPAMELEFQDSSLSPGLFLLPVNSRAEQNFFEYSLFQQSDQEFAPLRAYPDISMASNRFPTEDHTTQASECESLSQHPLAQTTVLSEEGMSSGALSPRSFHAVDKGRQKDVAHPGLVAISDRDAGGTRETPTDPGDKLVGEAAEDETFFLSKDIPAQHLLELLQKDVGMPSSSSSAVSSTLNMSLRSITSLAKGSKSTDVDMNQSRVRREGPSGEASLPQPAESSQAVSSEVCNITMGSRSTQPDDSSEALHRELLSEVKRLSSQEAQMEQHQRKSPLLDTCPTWTRPFSIDVERVLREQDLSSSGNQTGNKTGIDGSYLGFLPQSQSTPGLFKAPLKSNVKATSGQLSVIGSEEESSRQSKTGITPQPAVPEPDVPHSSTPDLCPEERTSEKVQSLPSLNYMQKVDAWRVNHTSGSTSLFDSLALQGFTGISPRKRAYDAVFDSLNRILSQKVKSLQNLSVSGAANQDVAHSASAAPSGPSSPRRGEAVGSAPGDRDDTGTAARPSGSSFGRSQSHSSLSTVVMSVQKDKEKGQTQMGAHHRASAAAQPAPLLSLGRFSDVSVEKDLTLSSSQDSYKSGVKFGASIGASSVTSLEVDYYDPYWTAKPPLTPPVPGPQELNIEERIPLYLHNLGIDQSPSTILTPFAPRGPIREPEFSPTEFYTIKGSVGTPTKSTQPSEGGSPHKEEFSRSSVLSVDSYTSVPFSLDSLGPAVSVPQQTRRRASPSADTDAVQSEGRLAPASRSHDDSHSPLQQTDSSLISNQNAVQLKERFDSDPSSVTVSMGRESTTSLWLPDPSAQPPAAAPAAGSTSTISKSSCRAEPEGCSAAPPDNKVPTQPQVIMALPAAGAKELISASAPEKVGVPEEQEKVVPEGPVRSSSSSPALEEPDQGGMSDGSSESSLAVRVAKLLQSDSPSTAVPSTPSITDQDESKARGWIQLKTSGRQREPVELDKEDRRRIEEIKRELLLKYPIKSQPSTDTESSVSSSVRVQTELDPLHSAETVSTCSDVKKQPLQGLATNLSDSTLHHQCHHHPDTLEARVLKIAAREGVKVPRSTPQALTSISIATCRRSTPPFPSPSTSPAPSISPASEPLHPSDLDTGTPERHKVTKPFNQNEEKTTGEPASVSEPDSSFFTRKQTLNSLFMSGSHNRQDVEGGQFKDPLPTSEDVKVKDDNTQSSQLEEILRHIGAGSSAPESPARTDHVSHVRLTLSPKTTHGSPVTAVHNGHPHPATGPALRPSSSPTISPDEGVGLSSPPEWCDAREPQRQQGVERADTSALLYQPQGRFTSTSKQPSTQHHRPEASKPAFTTQSPVPVLLPYKPPGSEDFFYVPQLAADVSSSGPSDTTIESSHTGSDDAVPPRFSSDVLGHQDPGLDRGVTIRHAEGIYSKRLKTATFRMHEPGHRDVSMTADKGTQMSLSRTPKTSQVSVALTRVPSSDVPGASQRDQRSVPAQGLSDGRPQLSHRSVPHTGNRQRRDTDVPQPVSQLSSSSLDQLWQRFCDRWTMEDSRPTSDREAFLLERLERLSRLMHSGRGTDRSERTEGRAGEDVRAEEKGQDIRSDRGSLYDEARGTERTVRGHRQFDQKRPVPRQAWTQRQQVQQTPEAPAEDDPLTSSLSHVSSQSLHLFPADRDVSDAASTASNSMSTIDTARLVRVFGAHRVQQLKSSASLSKLYNSINRQREGREQRRGRYIIMPPYAAITDQSSVSDSVSNGRGPSKTLAAMKAVKLVSKGIQTGDLEIVCNGTRPHTRDVGTMFPSPRESSASSVERGRGGNTSFSPTQASQKQRKSKRSPSKLHPAAISWFIAVDDLRSEAKKENRRDESAMFVPYSRTQAWREPLRQRQVLEDSNTQPVLVHQTEPEPDLRIKSLSFGPALVSLQEALEMRRPEFISRSTERVQRLALQMEHRKLQAIFTRDRDELLGRPGGPGLQPKPADTARLRRAVPRKEMIQRTKQMYENLPEVRRKKAEERRKAEYSSHRLNAKLYNKRITNHVLGR